VLRSVGGQRGGGTLTSSRTRRAVFFVNGGRLPGSRINVISNTDVLSGIHAQKMTNGLVSGNRISPVSPTNEEASVNLEGCGIKRGFRCGQLRKHHPGQQS